MLDGFSRTILQPRKPFASGRELKSGENDPQTLLFQGDGVLAFPVDMLQDRYGEWPGLLREHSPLTWDQSLKPGGNGVKRTPSGLRPDVREITTIRKGLSTRLK